MVEMDIESLNVLLGLLNGKDPKHPILEAGRKLAEGKEIPAKSLAWLIENQEHVYFETKKVRGKTMVFRNMHRDISPGAVATYFLEACWKETNRWSKNLKTNMDTGWKICEVCGVPYYSGKTGKGAARACSKNCKVLL